MLPETEIAWLAGIFDGEGGARIYRYKSGKQLRYHAQVQAVSNTDPEIIQRVQNALEALGMNGQYHKRRDTGNTKQPNAKVWWKACGDIRISGRPNIILFLETILPYTTGTKKAQAQHVLSFLRLQDSYKHVTKSTGPRPRPIVLQEQEESFFTTQTFARGVPRPVN